MSKSIFGLFLCLILSFCAFSQNSSRITIKGVLVDTLGEPLPFATVMLLEPKDSALVNFGRSGDNGEFEFKNVKRQKFIFKASFVGLLPCQYDAIPNETPIVDMGKLPMKPITKELLEVVVRTARAPLSIKGDTIEYNAASFKVPPGSTVEDLLRKLPGIQVNQDGSITAQGQDVKKVTVDGKSFFGNDPKLATKNLPADAIQKVQVFNDKSEQSKVTGVDDGKKEKTVNLELKEDAKKGGFGKIKAGAGTDSRAEVRGNYNKFDPSHQFSVIGFGNNLNQSGLSWNDYQDFRGSQSFNWGDEADFGFGSNRRFYTFEDTDEGLSIPIGNNNEGLSESYAGGMNFNYDTKKDKFSSNYFYNQSERIIDKIGLTQRFFQDKTLNTNDTSYRKNLSINHRASLRYEKMIDSTNTLVVVGNGRYSMGDASQISSIQQQTLLASNILPRRTTIDNFNDFNSFNVQATGLYRHKFKKKGRNFAASASYNVQNSDVEATQKSLNRLLRASNPTDSIIAIDQINDNNNLRKLTKSSLFYLEPLSKIFFWESFYNFSQRNEEVDRTLSDKLNDIAKRNDSLSRYYTNDITYNRLGTSIRYSDKGLNITVGIAAQQFDLNGDFKLSKTDTKSTPINRKYFNLIPKLGLNWDLKNNRYFNFDYELSTREPQLRDLQPIVDNSNPLYLREGNPDLLPTLQHNISGGYNMFNPASFINVYVNLDYNYYINQVVYNQSINEQGQTITKPANISGGNSIGSYIGLGFPIIKTKLTMNINTNFNLSKNPIFINDQANKTNNNNYSLGLRMSLTPSDKFTFYGNASWGINKTSYELPTAPNQTIYNNSYGGEMNIAFGKELYFATNLNYNIFKNVTNGFNQDLPILGMSVYKLLGKSKKTEIRLMANDIFNKNVGIRQNAYQNFVSREQTVTLSQYVMLSLTYNMRGVTNNMRKNRNSF